MKQYLANNGALGLRDRQTAFAESCVELKSQTMKTTTLNTEHSDYCQHSVYKSWKQLAVTHRKTNRPIAKHSQHNTNMSH
jgi:hypothetical protein